MTTIKIVVASLGLIAALVLGAGYYMLGAPTSDNPAVASEEIALEDIPAVDESDEPEEEAVQSSPSPQAPAQPVTSQRHAAENTPTIPPAPNNCHTRGSGCEDIESQVEAQWQAQQQEQPYDNDPRVTGVPCSQWTCRDAAGRSNAEIQDTMMNGTEEEKAAVRADRQS